MIRKITDPTDTGQDFAFELDGKTWFTVVYGNFPSYAQATAAGVRLAERLNGVKPWVRRLAVIQAAAIR